MNKEEAFKQEQNTLNDYLSDLQEFTDKEVNSLNNLYEQYLEDLREIGSEAASMDSKNEMRSIAEKKMKRNLFNQRQDYTGKLIKIMHSPYFSRIDVKQEGDEKAKTYYIGKTAFPGYTKKKEVTDWRSPIASLYYNYPFATKDAKFSVSAWNALDSDKIALCDLEIRRTIEIEHKKLINIYDDSLLDNIKEGKTDEFLLSKLSGKSGGRLEDIIETIQADQNEILRYSPFKNVLVQGVAGSGKTTIAIHRISFIFYNFKEKILPAETLFLSTSKVLINYLAKSLPELDIFDIKRASILEFIKEILDKNQIKLKTKLSNYEESQDLEKYFLDIKEFVLNLESFIKEYEGILREKFQQEVVKSSGNINFYDFDRTFKRFKNEPFLETVLSIQEDLLETSKELKKEIKYAKGLYSIDTQVRKLERFTEITKKIRSFLKNINLERAYTEFLIQFYRDVPKSFETNHICALYYLAYKLGGIATKPQYNLVLVDEAQDLNKLSLMCVKTFSRTNCFNFFGDINQSVTRRFSLNNWTEVEDIFSIEHTKKFTLNISYRSSKQIINKACEVLKQAGITENLPIPVSREGAAPIEKSFKSKTETLNELIKEVKELRKDSNKSIGIIQTKEFSINEIEKALKEEKIQAEVITEYFDNFKKDGIYIVPLRLVKGLEFDAIFVLNMNSEELNNKVEGHFKKFVCITRAMTHCYLYSVSL